MFQFQSSARCKVLDRNVTQEILWTYQDVLWILNRLLFLEFANSKWAKEKSKGKF